MSFSANTCALYGCSPVPLAHYLKALGILRLVTEQADANVAGSWQKDVFVLHSGKLNEDALIEFFLRRYTPTAILAPWNGGSGFHKKDNTEAMTAIEKSGAERFAKFRDAIAAARSALKAIGLKEKPSPEEKEQLLKLCRSSFPDDALAWLDAAFVLTGDGAKYPPLLGTGGNDGRLEFTNNFMQRLTEVINVNDGAELSSARDSLRACLFGGTATVSLNKTPVGQFFPGAAGGPNSTSGFATDSAVNPWDFILMLEGALLFAAAAVRRLEGAQSGALAYPFCVRQVAVGYGSASAADEEAARAEMWLPLWERPVGVHELAALLSEGRAQIGPRAARNGVDFARAVVTLGVDRGLSAFQRYGFQVRNGLSYFATPLERVVVRRNPQVDLLSEIDAWLIRFREKAGASAKQVPASISRALNQLERRILELCRDVNRRNPSRVQAVLIALGQAEKALAHSLTWTTGRNDPIPVPKIQPLAGLSAQWLLSADDGSREFRLAAALASITGFYKDKEGRVSPLHLRQHLEPVIPRTTNGRERFLWHELSNDVVWNDGNVVQSLNAVFSRRLLRAEQSGHAELMDVGVAASLADVVAFIEGECDGQLLADLVWALCLIDWDNDSYRDRNGSNTAASRRIVPPALFNLLRLTFPRRKERADIPVVPKVPAIHRYAAAGNGLEASRLAVRRLRGSNHEPAVTSVSLAGESVQRIAAALLFPISQSDLAWLKELVCKPETRTA